MDGVSLNSDPCRSRTCVVLPTVWCASAETATGKVCVCSTASRC